MLQNGKIADYNVRGNALSGNPDIYKRVEHLVRSLELGRVLDVGTGQGQLLKRLQANGHTQLFACDKHPEFFGVEGLSVDFCDINKGPLPYPDECFDTVFCVEVIEHIENPRALCREINRVLRVRGNFILTTPNCLSLRSRLSFLLRGYSSYFMDYPDHTPSPHIAMLSRVDLERIFRETMFSVQAVSFTGGAIPKLRVAWQQIFPFLQGELFSDTIIMVARKQGAV